MNNNDNKLIELYKLPETEYYLNTETGDLYLINWVQNRPIGRKNWVKISKECYLVITEGIYG